MNEKTKNIISIICFLTIILGIPILNILTPDKEVSMNERRKLAQFSSMNLSNYTEKFDFYDITHVLLYKNNSLNNTLKTDSNYNVLYEDKYYVFYERAK